MFSETGTREATREFLACWWNALSSTRWQNGAAALPPDYCAFGDYFRHRSEPDLHFQEKPIHPSRSYVPQQIFKNFAWPGVPRHEKN
jgi:hypothetical protein